MGSIQYWSKNFTALALTMIAGSACSRGLHIPRPTATSLTTTRTRGLEFVGLADGRPKDKFGIAAAYAHVSPRARALDLDFQRVVTPVWPARSFEGLVTAVYQYELRAGWTLQPNFQFIVRPGGGAASPFSAFAGKALKNAEVFGLRTVLKF